MARTFLNAKLAISSTLPTTFDDNATTGYPHLVWTEFCADKFPTIKRAFQAVTKTTICSDFDVDLKGSSKFDPVTFNFDPADSPEAAAILLSHFSGAHKTDQLALKLIFGKQNGETVPEVKYTTALVAGYADTNGGDKNTIDLKEVTLWIQREIFTVSAT